MEKGRLQTLPLATTSAKKTWYDMAGSGMRHFPGRRRLPQSTGDWPYTFKYGLHSCHVSQLYDQLRLQYRHLQYSLAEPGINCETCHGPSKNITALKELPRASRRRPTPRSSGHKFTSTQHNDSCSSCHQGLHSDCKLHSGERFSDHFDLVTLESADYYSDGRDLGENYTLTTCS